MTNRFLPKVTPLVTTYKEDGIECFRPFDEVAEKYLKDYENVKAVNFDIKRTTSKAVYGSIDVIAGFGEGQICTYSVEFWTPAKLIRGDLIYFNFVKEKINEALEAGLNGFDD